MGGYQISTLGGEDYLTLFDFRDTIEGSPAMSMGALGRSPGEYVVDFTTGPKPEGWGLLTATIERIVRRA